MNKMDEKILVVEHEVVFNNGHLDFQGFNNGLSVSGIIRNFDTRFQVRRGLAEENTDWKQLITYIIVKRGQEAFMYERLTGGGEARLHSKISIGVGGHMNKVNNTAGWNETFKHNAFKELNEELIFTLPIGERPSLVPVGLINDDSDAVGMVHLGIVAILDLPEDSDVAVRETDKLKGSWVNIMDLFKTEHYSRLENWSKLAVNGLFLNGVPLYGWGIDKEEA